MVVGAHAVAAHGSARMSSDIDFVLHMPLTREPEVGATLSEMGFAQIERRRDEWGRRLVVEEGGLEVEIFLTPPNVVYDRRVELEYHGERVPFLSPEDLVLRKLVNTRLRRGHDYDDAVGVLALQRGRLDLGYLRQHCAVYRICELLERAIAKAEATEK